MKRINIIFLAHILVITLLNCSCNGFLDIDPPKDKIAPLQAFENDEIATSAVTGIYSRMAVSGFSSGGTGSLSVLASLSSDELRSYNSTLDEFYQTEIAPSSFQLNNSIWSPAYIYIYTSNSILEGLQLASGVNATTARQLQGEAKFIRAFCYFYLVNLFGEVPLNLTTDYRLNEIASKSPESKIYDQIITDLKDAEALLSPSYITTERVRPNKWTATALLSRVYLYTKQWELAAQKATEVIDQKSTYTLLDDLDKVFLKNSSETIWQLMPTAGGNTNDGNVFILTATPQSVSLRAEFLTNFSDTDNRKLRWIKEFTNATGKYYYPFKYKVKSSSTITEYSMVMRLAELYLIRAEARAKQSQVDLALEDINLIRKRAGLINPLTGLNQTQCLSEVDKQRQMELFTEWGHRWLDLKRTGLANSVLAPIKGLSWKDTDTLYPIPESEVSRNPNMTQNLGYLK